MQSQQCRPGTTHPRLCKRLRMSKADFSSFCMRSPSVRQSTPSLASVPEASLSFVCVPFGYMAASICCMQISFTKRLESLQSVEQGRGPGIQCFGLVVFVICSGMRRNLERSVHDLLVLSFRGEARALCQATRSLAPAHALAMARRRRVPIVLL